MTDFPLVVSSGRRLALFKRTLQSFVQKNSEHLHLLSEVWVLDDRSTAAARAEMELLLREWFPQKSRMITFNSDLPFDFVEKFNVAQKIVQDADYFFLLEDDWQCAEVVDIPRHLEYLRLNPAVSQIAFSEPLSIQSDEIREKYRIGDAYWKNPYPLEFRHVFGLRDGEYLWKAACIKHYTNNPSIIRSSMFRRHRFEKQLWFESNFADRNDFLEYFTTEPKFCHIGGESSLMSEFWSALGR